MITVHCNEPGCEATREATFIGLAHPMNRRDEPLRVRLDVEMPEGWGPSGPEFHREIYCPAHPHPYNYSKQR